MLLVIVLVTIAGVDAALYLHTRNTLRDQYGQRALAVGRTVATVVSRGRTLVVSHHPVAVLS